MQKGKQGGICNMKLIKILLILPTVLLFSCAPVVSTRLIRSYPALPPADTVKLYDEKETVPGDAIELGTVKVDDSGFSTNCGWEVVIAKAKAEARKAGGNAIKIINHNPPSIFGSSCHRITALILKLDVSANADVTSSTDSLQKNAPLPVTETPAPKSKADDFQRLRLSVSGGYSYRLGKVSTDLPQFLQDYISDLKSGYHFSGDVMYMPSRKIGFGFHYSLFRASNFLNNIVMVDPVSKLQRTGMLKDDMTIQYFAPFIGSMSSSKNKKVHFIWELSLGYLTYRNEAAVIDEFTLTSNTLGSHYSFGFDFNIEKKVCLGFSLGLSSATLTWYQYDDGKEVRTVKLSPEQYDGLSRFDFSIGLRFHP
jgi:hypothetical protein